MTRTERDRVRLEQEFDRQMARLLEIGYARAAGMSNDEFPNLVRPLKRRVRHVPAVEEGAEGRLEFVIVVKSQVVPVSTAMHKAQRGGKPGMVKFYPIAPERFRPLPELDIPDAPVYLLCDIDRGDATLNVTPARAKEMIKADKGAPLTIDEGVAIITHFPEFLKKNHCFSLLGSRCGDRRVPALWLSGDRARLGWCWEGNPHAWLGSASCRRRIGP